MAERYTDIKAIMFALNKLSIIKLSFPTQIMCLSVGTLPEMTHRFPEWIKILKSFVIRECSVATTFGITTFTILTLSITKMRYSGK
jgi:hypothetical protein